MADENANTIKYLVPTENDWRELDPVVPDGTDEEGVKKIEDEAKKAKKSLNELLISSLQMQHVVVLAGSGTSLGPVGGPSMADLWNFVKANEDGVDKLKPLENVAKKVKYNIKQEHPNIEHFLSRCDAFLQVNEDDKEVKDCAEACKKIIIEKCDFELNEGLINSHATFLHRLSRRRVRDSRLKIFTTNYDLCFEYAAGKQGLIVLDGFSFTLPRHYDPRFFNYDIVRRPRSGEDLGSYLEGVFKLYKLHGSVNWARSGSAIEVKEKPSSEEACLIYPAKNKYQQSYLQPHLELIAQYLASLREPNTCVIVTGYGFNDDHLSEPILSAVKSNPHLRLILTDRSVDEKLSGAKQASPYWDSFKELAMKGEDIWFIKASFQDVANLIPDLRSLTPAERLVRDLQSVTGAGG